MVVLPIESEVKDAIEKIEEKVEKHSDEINQLKINYAVTNQRLDNIEKLQENIEKGQIKNREISLQNFNNMNQILNKNTDSILALSNNFLAYLTEKDNNITEENLNVGWNKREIKIAVITGVVTVISLAFGLYQALI